VSSSNTFRVIASTPGFTANAWLLSFGYAALENPAGASVYLQGVFFASAVSSSKTYRVSVATPGFVAKVWLLSFGYAAMKTRKVHPLTFSSPGA
jgi:hypothetical protein